MGPVELAANLFAEDLPKEDENKVFKLLPPQWPGAQSRPTFTAGCGAPQRADGGFSKKPGGQTLH